MSLNESNESHNYLKLYHGELSQGGAENLILDFLEKNLSKYYFTQVECSNHLINSFFLKALNSEVFLLRDDPENSTCFILSIYHLDSFYHIKIEQVEESFYKVNHVDIFHGLDTFIESAHYHKGTLPCRLKYFVKGITLPDSLRKFGRTVELHLAVSNSDYGRIREVLQADNSNINLKDSNGKLLLQLYNK